MILILITNFICIAPLKSHPPQQYKQTNKSKLNFIHVPQNDNHIASLALQANSEHHPLSLDPQFK